MKTTKEEQEKNRRIAQALQDIDPTKKGVSFMLRFFDDFAELEVKLSSARAALEQYADRDKWSREDNEPYYSIWEWGNEQSGYTLAEAWIRENPKEAA